MSLTLTVDQARYRDSMNQFVRRLNADASLLLREEMRLLLRDIISFTPPAQGNKRPSRTDLQRGENAIKGDLFGGKRKSGVRGSSIGLFQRIGTSTLVLPRSQKAGATSTYGVNLGWERSKTIRIYKKFWQPNATMASMMAFLQRYQNPRTGRPGHISQSVIGRHKVQDQMWISNERADALLKHVAGKVGYTMSGWIRGAQGTGLQLPKWVLRHEAYANGGYKPATPTDLNVEAVNQTAKIPNYFARHVYPAFRARVRSVESELGRLVAGGKSRRGSLAHTITGQAD